MISPLKSAQLLSTPLRAIAVLVGALGLALAACAAHAQIPTNSTWENQRGSTLQITSIDPTTGALRGTYINPAAGFACQGTPYDVIGWVDGGDKIGRASCRERVLDHV